jgi:acetoacetate decarboxylase
VPHVNAPVADLPVRRVLNGTHFIADLTLPYGRVLHDYLHERSEAHGARTRQPHATLRLPS